MKTRTLLSGKTMIASVAALVFALPLSLASCSDKDSSTDYVETKTFKESEALVGEVHTSDMPVPQGIAPEAAQEAIDRNNMKTEMLMSQLCEVDSTPGCYDAKYTPVRGEVLYATAPTSYYVIAFNAEHAESIYQSIVSVLQEGGMTVTMPNEVTQGDIHLRYIPGDGTDGILGRISVDCPRLKNILTTIIFITDAAYPNNDTITPCQHLSVWKQVKTGYHFICLREAKGGKGLLVTWDGGWTEKWFKDSYWQWDFSLSDGCMHQDHYDLLVGGMIFYPDRFKSVIDVIKKDAGQKNATCQMLSDMFYHSSSNRRCVCDYSAHMGRWWCRTNWYVDLRWVDVKDKKVYKHSDHYEHRSWPTDKSHSSFIIEFTQYDNAQFKDNTKWVALLR